MNVGESEQREGEWLSDAKRFVNTELPRVLEKWLTALRLRSALALSRASFFIRFSAASASASNLNLQQTHPIKTFLEEVNGWFSSKLAPALITCSGKDELFHNTIIGLRLASLWAHLGGQANHVSSPIQSW